MKTSRRPQLELPSRPSQARIGRGLRAVFDEVTASPLPDRLADLSEKLEAALARGELSCRRQPKT